MNQETITLFLDFARTAKSTLKGSEAEKLGVSRVTNNRGEEDQARSSAGVRRKERWVCQADLFHVGHGQEISASW
jgi:hypothetical protein